MVRIGQTSEKSITMGDVLYARVSFMGKQLFNIQLRDVSSLSQIFDWVRSQLGNLSGMVKISLRNASQGWTADHWCRLTTATIHSAI